MPCTKHCSICGKPFKGEFQDVMAKLRRHRKQAHPTAHRRSVKKAQRTKAKLDPKIRKRRLTATPTVRGFIDYKGRALVRVLDRRPESNLFAEFALYVKFRNMPHNVQDQMLKDAGLTEESKGKWVLRTNKFSIFVFV